MMRAFRNLLAVGVTLAMTACHSAPKQDVQDGKLRPVTGHGRLLSVDQASGTGTMDIDGKTVNFWWLNQIRRAATSVGPGGDYESTDVDIPFRAKIGDMIYFKGMESRGEIFINSATDVKQK